MKMSAGNVFIFVMAVVIGSLLAVALIGYMSGGWEVQP